MFYLTTHSTHFIYGYMVSVVLQTPNKLTIINTIIYIYTSVIHLLYICTRKEGNVLFNDTLNTFYLRLYGVSCLTNTQQLTIISTIIYIYTSVIHLLYICTN